MLPDKSLIVIRISLPLALLFVLSSGVPAFCAFENLQPPLKKTWLQLYDDLSSGHFSALISYENQYNLPELSITRLVIAGKFKPVYLKAACSFSGDEKYSETLLGLSAGRRLGRVMPIIRWNYYLLDIRSYGSKYISGISAGLKVKLPCMILIDARLENIYTGRYRKGYNDIPCIYAQKLQFPIDERLSILLFLEKTADSPFDYGIGFSYNLNRNIQLRISAGDRPSFIGFSVLFNTRSLTSGISTARINPLGWSNCVFSGFSW